MTGINNFRKIFTHQLSYVFDNYYRKTYIQNGKGVIVEKKKKRTILEVQIVYSDVAKHQLAFAPR